MSGSAAVNYPAGPLLSGGVLSPEWQRFFLNIWTRTGSAQGFNLTTIQTNIALALKQSGQAEADAQSGIQAAAAAQLVAALSQGSADNAAAATQALEIAVLMRPLQQPQAEVSDDSGTIAAIMQGSLR